MKYSAIGAVNSKTVGFGVLVIVLGILESHSNFIAGFLPAYYQGLAVSAIGTIVILLRMITDTSLKDKGKEIVYEKKKEVPYNVGKSKLKFEADEPHESNAHPHLSDEELEAF